MNLIKPLFTASLIAMSVSSAVAGERVIVQVDNAGKGIVKKIAREAGASLKVDGDGFVALEFSDMNLDQIRGVFNNPHVKLIEKDQVRKPMALFNDDLGDPMAQQITPYGYYQSQSDQVSFNPNAGIKVCVIDSGLDSSNPDFIWSNITGDNDPGTGNWFDGGGEHGTHVAGTIGAADNSYGVIGMAPGVDMHIIKVFNASGWGYSSTLAQAVNLCGQAGADIINMSLGGGGTSSTEENAMNAFRDAGGLIVAAAGNDGNTVRSYPAGYSAVMMVGANDANDQIASFSQHPSCQSGRGKNVTTDETICVEIAAGGVDTLSTFPAGLASTSSLTADSQPFASSGMENSGSATGQTYYMGTAQAVDSGANGKVCVIDRGVISFYDKVNNCEQSGGIGAVIINNEAGMLYGTLGTANDTTIPAVGAALEDRSALLSAATMDIYIGASDYGYLSGTSMATPTVAGVAALVWSNHASCSGEEVRAALKATARDAGNPGKDVYFGHGIVQAAAANAYLASNPCGGTEPPPPPPPSGDFTLSANGYKVKGTQQVDLSWSGASTANVDIYRDGQLLATVSDSGQYTDVLNTKGGGIYTYQVCEEATSTCTNTTQVVF